MPELPGPDPYLSGAYLAPERLCTLHVCGAFFITRAKSNTDLRRLYSAPTDRKTGIFCDQTVVFAGVKSVTDYPHKLRRIKLKDLETGHLLVFLTNNFALPATTIAEFYRNRWQVELFFKWIKQHLRIKIFTASRRTPSSARSGSRCPCTCW